MPARKDNITWSEYFMGIATLASLRSKDPNTQVGACIVNDENKIVGIGYNGFPNGCSDSILPWERTGKTKADTKYMYVIHAELNAILNSIKDLKGCTLYVTLFPCHECMKIIIQSGIKSIVFLNKNLRKECKDSVTASERMLELASIKCKQYCRRDGRLLDIKLK